MAYNQHGSLAGTGDFPSLRSSRVTNNRKERGTWERVWFEISYLLSKTGRLDYQPLFGK